MLVVFRHARDLGRLQEQHPEDPLVKRLVPSHAELLGVADRRLLQEPEKLGGAQAAVHVHVLAAQQQLLAVDAHCFSTRL